MKKGPIGLVVVAFVVGCVYTLAHHGYIEVEKQPAAVTTIGTINDAPVSKMTVADPAEAQKLISTASTH
ncbi:MAG: hypothetical protein ACXVDB_04520 [Tumebacillaceae bacterium]